ncbi:FHA domain-containing protein [Lujinxingia sediminis]|uniref:FHA domain-containing protein n=1 Tax=Lujinxingia sediminis TaxID=2480984 RepID=A0ABY0CXI9_9DELT|nr:FHA domain-containing protein [Lujinxingia sediminis]RVU48155.1 FHA domain-containing protein [Lujinxingia sediminis]
MSSARLCANCKAVVPEEHFYCGRCGASYNEDGREQANETLFFGAMQAPGRAKIILISGQGLEGLSYHLNSTTHVAGRSNGVILFPDDPFLSEKHASFFYKANKLYLRDEKSLNGTFKRIREPRALQDGEEFLVGQQRFRLELLDLKSEYPMREDTLMYVSPPRPYTFRIVHVLDGGRPGAAYCNAENTLTIGREGTDVIFPDDRHISKSHARLVWREEQVWLEDLDSKNGTYAPVSGEAEMIHGDYVFLGSELMRIEINA